MPRRKQLIFKIQDLKCAVHIIEELSKLPQLNNFDMKSIELTIKENKPTPQILKKDIDTLVDRLQRGFSANKHKLTQLNGYYLITNIHLSKWMKVTPATVNKWLKDGLIKYSEKSYDNLKFFDVNEVISQLRKQKQ
ncbi:hypothetical protein B5F25_03280 [Bacteroides sp. An19]|jgi:hypothetical protein|nr:hypothetical protein B5F25_03280 [Bacteroides sp. An19]